MIFSVKQNFPSFSEGGCEERGEGVLVVVRKAVLKMLNETKSAILKMRTSKLSYFSKSLHDLRKQIAGLLYRFSLPDVFFFSPHVLTMGTVFN